MCAHRSSLIVRRGQCPGCSSTDLGQIYKRSYDDPRIREYMELAYQGNVEYEYLDGGDYEIVECLNCHLLFQTNVLNAAGAQRLYDVWINPDLAEKWCGDGNTVGKFRYGILRFVQRHLHRPKVKMLDYGAGFGHTCLQAKELGFDVSALEFSIERASSLEKLGIRPVMPDEAPDNHYDFINLDQVLEHLTDPFETLQRVERALTDDGLVFLSVPNCRSLKGSLKSVDSLPMPQFQQALLNCSAFQHINCFNHHALMQICARAGFETVFRPFLLIACSGLGDSPKALAKNLLRPFYYRMDTTFFLRKAK